MISSTMEQKMSTFSMGSSRVTDVTGEMVEEEGVTVTVLEEDGLSLSSQKAIVLASIAVVTFTLGMIPFKFISKLKDNRNHQSQARWKLAISFSSCFAGGVFLGACLLDLLPEVEEVFEGVMESAKREYPVAQLTVGIGFLIILFIEQTVAHFQEKWHDEERQPLLASQKSGQSHDFDNSVSEEIHQSGADGHHDHSHLPQEAFQHSALRSLMLLLALSFHGVFEGLAVGLQQSSSEMLSLTIAVVVHEAIMSFSLGLSLAQSGLSIKSFVVSNLLHCVSSPLGVAIGIPLSSLPPSLARDAVSGFLQGIAGGTFLYITFFEILPPELTSPNNRLWKVLFVALGFASMCCIVLI